MADITLQQAQQMVDSWIKTYGVRYFNELTNMNFPIIYTMDVEPLDNNVAYQMIMKKYNFNSAATQNTNMNNRG